MCIRDSLYAEDPAHDFLPQIGRLSCFDYPTAQAWQRVDTGFQQGDEISPYYDPMLAKVIAWGDNRELAISRLLQTLSAMRVSGLRHNLSYLQRVVGHPDFIAGQLATDFLVLRHDELLNMTSRHQQAALLVASAYYFQQQTQRITLVVTTFIPRGNNSAVGAPLVITARAYN